MKSRGSLSILHLSDIHFGMDDPNGEQGLISDAIVRAIEKVSTPIDVIVFTGDLAQAGRATELQQGQEWLERVAQSAKSQCIIVPGNHDLNRNHAKKPVLRAAMAGQEEYGSWSQEILKDHQHILPFLEWFSECKQESTTFLNNWKSNPLIDTIVFKNDSINCRFICINTAFLSCANDDEGNLCVDVRSLNHALKDSKPDNELTIVVGHHPLNWLTNWNKELIQTALERRNGPHAYLHGHLHSTDDQSRYTNEGNGIFTGAAGAAYPGSKYKKHFSLLHFNLEEKEVECETFVYQEKMGEWIKDNSLSNPVPCRLPSLPLVQSTKTTNEAIATEVLGTQFVSGAVSNPFHDYMANGMDAEDIHLLFVERRNSLQDLKTKHDSVVEGQRGTGKTMLLRYFSIEVQKSFTKSGNGADLINNLNSLEVPIGIYCCLTNAGLDRTDFQAIPDKNRARLLFSHLATLFLITKLLKSIADSLLDNASNNNILTTPIRTKICSTLKTSTTDDLSDSEFIEDVLNQINSQRDDTYEHLASCLPGGTPTAFNPRLSLTASLFDLLEHLKSKLKISQPFFLLIDDFDKLDSLQQSIFFSAAAARRHDVVCFKFGALSEGIKSKATIDGRRYSEGDDYDHIPLDWVDGGIDPDKNREYKESLEEITKRRLKRASWPDSITLNNLFENWGQGSKIYNDVRLKVKEDFSAAKKPTDPQAFASYWSKQGTAMYFRYLAKKKISHRYAGPATIIEVSSGIYRQFLEVCGRIVNAALARGWTPTEAKTIGMDTQNRCIREWSTGMFKNLESSGDATNLSSENTLITSDHLTNLANSLTLFFRWKLLSGSNDPEVIAISIKDEIVPGSFVKALLDVAVRETLLQRRATDYTNKSGDGKRLPTFQLNRRLTPHVGIGTKIQGRHELSSFALELAARDTKEFLRHMKADPSPDQTQLHLD